MRLHEWWQRELERNGGSMPETFARFRVRCEDVQVRNEESDERWIELSDTTATEWEGFVEQHAVAEVTDHGTFVLVEQFVPIKPPRVLCGLGSFSNEPVGVGAAPTKV